MSPENNQIKSNKITTDDLAFSAFLRMQGYRLIKVNQNRSNSTFTFEITREEEGLKIEFINSQMLTFYNELRNLKKLI